MRQKINNFEPQKTTDTMNRRTAMMILCAAAAAHAYAQDATSTQRTHFVTAKADAGIIANTNDFLDGLNAHNTPMKHFSSYSVGFGWQTNGSHEWEHIHNFPSFGVALYTASFDNSSEIGRPVSLYGFYKGTLWRGQRAALQYNVDMGMAFNWTCFDKESNPYNIAIGSPATVHIGLGLEYTYSLCDHITIGAGANATHFSNGAIRKPNKGLNLLSPFVRLAYNIESPARAIRRTDFGKLKAHELTLTAGFGIKRSECDTIAHPTLDSEYQNSVKYTASTLQIGYLRQYGHKGKYGGGVSIVYDDWLGSQITVNGQDISKTRGKCSQRFTLGIYAAHELCIDKLSIITQLGAYVLQPDVEQSKPRLFERAGLKYELPFGAHVGVNIYAHNFTKADFIEWNVGYRLRWGEKCIKE